jgi:mycofactocin precursor
MSAVAPEVETEAVEATEVEDVEVVEVVEELLVEEVSIDGMCGVY